MWVADYGRDRRWIMWTHEVWFQFIKTNRCQRTICLFWWPHLYESHTVQIDSIINALPAPYKKCHRWMKKIKTLLDAILYWIEMHMLIILLSITNVSPSNNVYRSIFTLWSFLICSLYMFVRDGTGFVSTLWDPLMYYYYYIIITDQMIRFRYPYYSIGYIVTNCVI